MKMQEIEKLINNNQLDQAQSELSKLGETFFKNAEYLYLRSKIFYLKKLYYIAIDTLLTASEFKKEDKIDNKEITKIDLLNDKEEKMLKIIADNPLIIGGMPGRSIRDRVTAWEADIKYYETYMYDKSLIPGIYYRIKDDKIIGIKSTSIKFKNISFEHDRIT